ncbi:zinc-finger domain-containing protein [Magnetospirillum gryphiswaldense]|uniref:Uncharacterized protein conserved in bacteria n=2 Tax=Magnetospirillum gryphiswaldense TaxID=55518 RepID=V6F7Q5_MAGGM|nr:zinc-finger domain-containing protein [Magnetospirillum gryphiswaldense]AVM75311.1 Zinc-finger domain protein [Magnetospirillum gryphiswaldense MSR-1]AVM79214.1 Zinc-finger domain protein [Magnetospirillum gryphiswaldense]CDL00326.1 Uncharacterized protein conserved in bacteria [Magnetospirillum gryphiswaldense MSR-1 v2]
MSSAAAAKTAEFETIVVETNHVACDGGNAGLGHPRVYLNMGHDRQVVCPYCSRTYVLAEGAKVGGGH